MTAYCLLGARPLPLCPKKKNTSSRGKKKRAKRRIEFQKKKGGSFPLSLFHALSY